VRWSGCRSHETPNVSLSSQTGGRQQRTQRCVANPAIRVVEQFLQHVGRGNAVDTTTIGEEHGTLHLMQITERKYENLEMVPTRAIIYRR
jgi:hypothetical protein